MEAYPNVPENAKIEDLVKFAKFIQYLRNEDIEDFNNLNNIFMLGRKVGKIPTGSADVAATDRLGDFNYTATYFYILVDNSGAVWRRITLGSW